MNILLLSSYHANSHCKWCEGLMHNIPANWTLLSLSARNFSWRIRGNSLSWAFRNRSDLLRNYDLIIATSMTDLNGLIGFVPVLGKIPSLVYFHENQFAYPASDRIKENRTIENVEPMLVPVYAALSANAVCFNTNYNANTFRTGLKQLLKRLPDYVPAGLVEQIDAHVQQLIVPVDDDFFPAKLTEKSNVFSLVWNHRWEYDKWPECLFLALELLNDQNITFELYILGEQFSNSPEIFNEAKDKFSHQIKRWGRVEDVQDYQAVLRKSHVVVSTALHDFQGLAVLEAVASGCLPVVPDRLAYCELFDEKYRYASCMDDIDQQAKHLSDHLINLYEKFKLNKFPLAPDVSELSWHNKKHQYAELIEKVAGKPLLETTQL